MRISILNINQFYDDVEKFLHFIQYDIKTENLNEIQYTHTMDKLRMSCLYSVLTTIQINLFKFQFKQRYTHGIHYYYRLIKF